MVVSEVGGMVVCESGGVIGQCVGVVVVVCMCVGGDASWALGVLEADGSYIGVGVVLDHGPELFDALEGILFAQVEHGLASWGGGRGGHGTLAGES